jgi:tetratricopeptide (TPR) repeat protein
MARRALIGNQDHPELRDAAAGALRQLANALRVSGDFEGSAAAFRDAAMYIRPERGDLRAEWCSMAASLYRDQGRFSEAASLLEEEAALRALEPDEVAQARSFLSRALLAGKMRLPAKAAKFAKDCLALLNPRSHHLLWESAMYCLCYHLLDAGKVDEARRCWRANTPLRSFTDVLLVARRLWLEGRIASFAGEYFVAETKLGRASDTFLRQGQELDAALVGIDIADMCRRIGDRKRCLQVAGESLKVLMRYGAAEVEVCREIATGVDLWPDPS